jgi:hypothetical protein
MPPAIITFYTESCLWHVRYRTVTLYLRGFFLHRMISGHLRKLTEMKKLGLFCFESSFATYSSCHDFHMKKPPRASERTSSTFLTHNVPLSSLACAFLSLLDSCQDLDLANHKRIYIHIGRQLKYTVRTYRNY